MALTPPPGSRATVTPIRPGSSNWLNQCQRVKGPNSNPLFNLNNTLLALRLDPAWKDQLRYDEMLNSVVNPDTAIEDIDIYRIHEWMQANGLPRLGTEVVREAVEIVGREHPFHPLRDWLRGLQFDGTQRTHQWLHTYVGTADNDYYGEIGQTFLIAMVRRIFEPGCKSDYMLVLEGPQRSLKSTLCRALAGEKYFSDSMPNLGDDPVRVSMHLRGKWLIEVAELAAFMSSKVDAARLKSFLSSPVEQFVPKHFRKEVAEPRQCLFIGTTNDKQYLRDATGGTRFWPVECGTIDIDAFNRDREQLFAEATQLYRLGTPSFPSPVFETKVIAPVQDLRYEADAWDKPVLDYLTGKTQVTLIDVASEALFMTRAMLRTTEQRRIAAIMRDAGWHQARGTAGARFWTK